VTFIFVFLEHNISSSYKIWCMMKNVTIRTQPATFIWKLFLLIVGRRGLCGPGPGSTYDAWVRAGSGPDSNDSNEMHFGLSRTNPFSQEKRYSQLRSSYIRDTIKKLRNSY
jgi:hypothetical protein